MLIQLTGLSGAGKTSIAYSVKAEIERPRQLQVEVIDADEYRRTVCKDLGFSKEDRCENIRRLGKIAEGFMAKGAITIIAAINPYIVARRHLKDTYNAKTVWIYCPLSTLIKRDTKGLYERALQVKNGLGKINNLTGINDPYELPEDADLVINTALESLQTSAASLTNLILQQLSELPQ